MSGRFPVRPEEFETSFIEQIFEAAPGSLQSLTHEPVGTGQVCDSYRFTCDWAEGDRPATFIAKCPSADPVSRGAAAIFHLYDMEVGWYRDVASGSGVCCPPILSCGYHRGRTGIRAPAARHDPRCTR